MKVAISFIAVYDRVKTDASNVGLGAALMQYIEGKVFPISFSKKLSNAEKNYSTTEKECLAIIGGVKFHNYLHEKEFIIETYNSL